MVSAVNVTGSGFTLEVDGRLGIPMGDYLDCVDNVGRSYEFWVGLFCFLRILACVSGEEAEHWRVSLTFYFLTLNRM